MQGSFVIGSILRSDSFNLARACPWDTSDVSVSCVNFTALVSLNHAAEELNVWLCRRPLADRPKSYRVILGKVLIFIIAWKPFKFIWVVRAAGTKNLLSLLRSSYKVLIGTLGGVLNKICSLWRLVCWSNDLCWDESIPCSLPVTSKRCIGIVHTVPTNLTSIWLMIGCKLLLILYISAADNFDCFCLLDLCLMNFGF